MSNRLSTCHETEPVLHIKLWVFDLLSKGNYHPFSYISNGLFAVANVTWVSIKQKKILRGGKTNVRIIKKEIHNFKENPLGSFKSESQCAVWPGPPKDSTGGEVGGLAKKLIQLGRTSQQRHVGFQRSTPSSEKAPFSRSPSLHVVSDTGIRVSERLLKIVPTSYSSRVFFEKRKEHPRSEPRFAPRTHGAVRGVPDRKSVV